jgi:Flp pilus assembly pilin Flp
VRGAGLPAPRLFTRHSPHQGIEHLHVDEVEMQIALTVIQRFRRREEGQDLLEYGMLAALIAIVALGAVQAVGNTVFNVFWAAIAAASV